MSVKRRISATIEPALLAEAQRAANRGTSRGLSAWLNEAVRQKLEDDRRRNALQAYIAHVESQDGPITDDEIARAERDVRARAIVVRGPRRTRRARSKRAKR